jgi:hypothetical protein
MTRPRFSLRTLAIVVTLLCAYFAAWPLTTKYGVPRIPEVLDRNAEVYLVNAEAPAPLIVRQDVLAFQSADFKRHYYLWLGVTKIKLPYEASWYDDELLETQLLELIKRIRKREHGTIRVQRIPGNQHSTDGGLLGPVQIDVSAEESSVIDLR